MLKKVVADASSEPLTDGLDAEGLHTLQAKPQQHRDEIEPDDDAYCSSQA